MTILVIHHTLGVTWINIAPESIRKSYHYAQAYPSGRPEQRQQRGHLFVDRRQVPLDDQMQRRRAARAMAEGQPLQHALVEMGRMRSSGNQPKPT